MAKQTITNAESGLITRGKLNSNFTEIYSLAMPLTGLSLVSTADVSALDTLLVAIGKLQANKARTFFKDGSQAMEADVDMNNYLIKQVADAVGLDQAVNLGQLLAAFDGRQPKAAVRAASITDDVDHYDEQTHDGVALVDGDRFLDKDNANKAIRGIWIVKAGDAWVRSDDADTGLGIQGAEVAVTEGTQAGTAWYQYVKDVDLGVTDLYWQQQGANAPNATNMIAGIMKKYTTLAGNETDGAPTVYAVAQAIAALTLTAILASDNSAGNQQIKDLDDPTDPQDADTLIARETAVTALGVQLIDGADSGNDTFKKLSDKIAALNAIVGSSAPDGDSLVNTVTELLAIFATFPEGVDVVTVLAGKVNTTDIYNALDCIVSGKVLDARQGKALKDLIDALTATVSALTTTVGTKAADSAVVHNTGAEAIAGVKTFSSAPIVPTGSLGAGGTNAASQQYADTAASRKSAGSKLYLHSNY